jgi:hypothetical protein
MGRWWKALDAFRDDFTFRQLVAHGKRLWRPHFVGERRAALMAGFEIFAREVPPLAVLVRLGRAKFPLRQWIHERHEPVLGTRMVRYQDIADEMSVRTSLTHFEGACLGESYAP